MKCMVLPKSEEPEAMERNAENKKPAPVRLPKPALLAVTHSRRSFENRFVYAVISQRAGGLSIGVNMNPDKYCNFNCPYCEVDRTEPGRDSQVDVAVMSTELRNMLTLVREHRVRELPGYQMVPEALLELKGVALSGV